MTSVSLWRKIKKGGKLKLKTIIWLIVLVLVVIFAIQNVQSVELSVYFWKFECPKIILIFVSLVLGFFAGIFLRSLKREEKKKETPRKEETTPKKDTGKKRKKAKGEEKEE